MKYESNLTCPDLRRLFKHRHERVMPHSQGHDVLSDWADLQADHEWDLYKNCGFWTQDEAAILYACAKRWPGRWLDIGAHTGWTAAHMIAAGSSVTAIEPMLRNEAWVERFEQNLQPLWGGIDDWHYLTSDEYFATERGSFIGAVIDGDHVSPHPLRDAQNAMRRRAEVILLHDLIGADVQEAAVWLMDQGWGCRVYWTPHMVACCWRGGAEPPDHVRDVRINWRSVARAMNGFPFWRTS